MEPAAHPSSLRGTADVRITIYVAAFEQLLPTRGNHRLQSPGYLCPPRARTSVCRQIASGKTSRLSHVRPEMQTWGAQPRSNTENSTGPPAPTAVSAFRKRLHQPSAESPAFPPGVYWESRDRYRSSTRSRITSESRPESAQHASYEKAFEQSFGDSSQSRISTRVAAQTLESNKARSDLYSRRL